MFWIAILGFGLSWVLVKLGFLTATTSFMALVIKLLVLVIIAGVAAYLWTKFRKRAPSTQKDD